MSIIFTKVPYIIPPEGGGGGGGPCSGAIFADDLDSLNGTYWELVDINGISRFNNGLYEMYNPTGDYTAKLRSQGKFYLQGDFDFCVGMSVDSIGYISGTNIGMHVQLQETGKGASSAAMILKVQSGGDPSPGDLMWETDMGITPDWTSPPGGSGAGSYHIVRMVRVGTVFTAFIWNPTLTRWEWNGDTDGLTDDQVWDADIQYIWLTHAIDGASDYIMGGFDYFYLNSGTIYIP